MAQLIKTKSFWLAILTTLICSLGGLFLSKLPYLSLIGALVISLLLGMFLQVSPKVVAETKGGIGFISNKFLRIGIILLGFKLNLMTLINAGVKTITLAIVAVTFTICLTYYLCHKFGAEKELALLTACGCGICGAAAVMGVSPQLEDSDLSAERKRENEVLAVAVVCVMGTFFTLVEIFLKPLLGLDATQFGTVAGGSIHEVAHAVATGGAGGSVSLQAALLMKLSRVLLLAPVALIVGIWYQKTSKVTNQSQVKKKLPIPWFMGGFILASVAGTFLPFNQAMLDFLVQAAYLFLGMAMAALGMSVNFRVIAQRGRSVFAAAFISSTALLVLVTIVSKLFF